MVIEQPGAASPLFFWGPAGCGKTHLLAALKNELRAKHHLRRVVMLSAEQFTNDFTGAVRGSGLPGFRRRYRDVDALLIDDVQFVGGKRATLRELLYTVDSLLRGRCQLAFTGDRPPLELEGLNEELSGRLAGGMVCPLRPLDRPTRLKILQSLAHRQPYAVDSSVLERLAEELAGDGRILNGAMNHLRTLSQMLGRAVSWDELSNSAPDLIAAGRPTVNLGDIQKAVCDMFGLPLDSLRTRGQQRAVSQPRMLAMYLARQYTRAAFSEIGEFFGNRSHSTVIAATKRVEDWLAESTPVRRGAQSLGPRQAIEAIENLLRTG
jgi:chromosomal replication initiator protein